ncbi:MAG: type II toxin-antitoxin system HicB family antitoxin [Candidatus Acidiferrales bacterium]
MKQNAHDDYKMGTIKAADCLLTIIIQKKGHWYIGTVKELPSANSQGRTLSEVRRNLKEAVQLIVNKHALIW